MKLNQSNYIKNIDRNLSTQVTNRVQLPKYSPNLRQIDYLSCSI